MPGINLLLAGLEGGSRGPEEGGLGSRAHLGNSG